uniref:Uncharacterized protein n=1 Tax=Anguilla anguilla TaxID=7936 RepID=A0A0E9QET3_ANGAN
MLQYSNIRKINTYMIRKLVTTALWLDPPCFRP